MTQFVLMNPGPVNVSDAVRRAIAGIDLCHREPEFFDLQDRVRSNLLAAFELDPTVWSVILLTGSGTCALEAAVTSSMPPVGEMLVLVNGVYGDRISRIAAAHRIPHERVESGWTEPHDLQAVEMKLATGRFPLVAAVHHETTTGMLNPTDELCRIADRHGATVLLDSISGLGGEALDFGGRGGPGLVAGTANKCVEGLPGISFVFVRRAVLERMREWQTRSLYLHLPLYFEEQESRSTPFTPAVQVMFALDAALGELLHETVPGRIARYRRAARILRDGFDELGLEYLLPPERRSNTITTLRLPSGVDYDALHDALKTSGYVIYAGQGRLRSEAFRVANMGHIPETALHAFGAHLRGAIENVRRAG